MSETQSPLRDMAWVLLPFTTFAVIALAIGRTRFALEVLKVGIAIAIITVIGYWVFH